MSTGATLRQRVQQRLGLLEVWGVKALGEPPVDWRQEAYDLLALALGLPQAGQAGGGTEFPGFRLLALGYRNGVSEAGVGFRGIL